MSFVSQHSGKIWDDLYQVNVPNGLTTDPQKLKIFGTRLTGNKEVDKATQDYMKTVKIPIIRILEYYDKGIRVEIPSRDDMLQMYRNIKLYLDEWKEYSVTAINSGLEEHKALLTGLDSLAKRIHEKASPREVLSDMFSVKKFGLVSPMSLEAQEPKETMKPNYAGISELIRRPIRTERY